MKYCGILVVMYGSLVGMMPPPLLPKPSDQSIAGMQASGNGFTLIQMMMIQMQQHEQLLKVIDMQSKRIVLCEAALEAFKQESKQQAASDERKRKSQEIIKQEAKKQKVADYNSAIIKIGARIEAHEKKVARLLSTFLKNLCINSNTHHADLEALITGNYNETQKLLETITNQLGGNASSSWQDERILASLSVLSADSDSQWETDIALKDSQDT